MRRLLALGASCSLLALALAVPAGAAAKISYALRGEARALEIGIAGNGATFGVALAEADSTPFAQGIGAGQCDLLGDEATPEDAPCNESTTERSSTDGDKGDAAPTCAQNIDQLKPTVLVQLACGTSVSKILRGQPLSKNNGKVSGVGAVAPVSALLNAAESQAGLVNDLTDSLDDILTGVAPKEIKEKVDELVGTLDEVLATDVVDIQVGPSHSDVIPKGNKLTVTSAAAGARIGILALPALDAAGAVLDAGQPLKDGLVIIDVGAANASATVDRKTAAADADAAAALVTVKIRDITSPDPEYVTVSVAPGETVTVLEGTPAESTITAADSSTEEKDGRALAGADAVRLHLLKGVQGGITVGLARATAAAQIDKVLSAPPKTSRPPLPVTGARDLTLLALGLIAASGALLGLRRRFSSR